MGVRPCLRAAISRSDGQAGWLKAQCRAACKAQRPDQRAAPETSGHAQGLVRFLHSSAVLQGVGAGRRRHETSLFLADDNFIEWLQLPCKVKHESSAHKRFISLQALLRVLGAELSCTSNCKQTGILLGTMRSRCR